MIERTEVRSAGTIALVLLLVTPAFAQLKLDTKPDDSKKVAPAGGVNLPGDKGGDKQASKGAKGKQKSAGKGKAADNKGSKGKSDNKGSSDKQKAKKGDSSGSDSQENEGGNSFLSSLMSAGLMGYMIEGGAFMWPILIVGIVAAGVIIERYRSLSMLNTDTEDVRRDVQQLLEQDNIEQAIHRCDEEQGPVPAILGAGLRKYLLLRRLDYDAGRIEEQVVKAMEDYNVHVVAALERHLPVLATISSVAPMLGFLGTVSGMITSFKDIIARISEANIVVVAAGGISEALLTTCFGLIVGIPAFIAYNYFTSVINRYVLDVEESATELIEGVTMQLALEESTEVPV